MLESTALQFVVLHTTKKQSTNLFEASRDAIVTHPAASWRDSFRAGDHPDQIASNAACAGNRSGAIDQGRGAPALSGEHVAAMHLQSACRATASVGEVSEDLLQTVARDRAGTVHLIPRSNSTRSSPSFPPPENAFCATCRRSRIVAVSARFARYECLTGGNANERRFTPAHPSQS
jgi:hypothetical protein